MPTTQRPAGPRRGFTLLEMLLVVTIIGIMVALAVPRIGTASAASKAEQAIVVLHGDLQKAMAAASQQRVQVELTFTSASQQLLGETVDAAGTRRTIFSRTFGAGSDYAATLALTSGGAAVSGATVLPNGFVTRALCFAVTSSGPNGGQARYLSVTRAGQARILRGTSPCS